MTDNRTGNGYNYHGEKAERMTRTLNRIKRNPDLGRKLFGLPPKGGADGA